MKLLICGGRDFTDLEFAIPRIHRVHETTPVAQLICGMAKGGDMIGYNWAKTIGVRVLEFPADWDRYGRKAGPIRNQQMLDEGSPDRVVALPGGTGTAHMVSIAKAAGVPVTLYTRLFFSGANDAERGFLSNFWPTPLLAGDGQIYKSNEHFYQSQKTLDPLIQKWIAESSDARTAKKRGNHESVPVRPDWGDKKISVMREGLRMKFARGSDQAFRLLATTDFYLVEYAPWGDRFWGVDKSYKGENWLGRLLMERRDDLNG